MILQNMWQPFSVLGQEASYSCSSYLTPFGLSVSSLLACLAFRPGLVESDMPVVLHPTWPHYGFAGLDLLPSRCTLPFGLPNHLNLIKDGLVNILTPPFKLLAPSPHGFHAWGVRPARLPLEWPRLTELRRAISPQRLGQIKSAPP